MKLKHLVLAISASALPLAAVAEVTVSPMVGYHFFGADSDQGSLDDAVEFSGALGYRLSPNVGIEARGATSNPRISGTSKRARVTSLTGDIYYRFLADQRFQPYVLAGLGLTKTSGASIPGYQFSDAGGTIVEVPGAMINCVTANAGTPPNNATVIDCDNVNANRSSGLFNAGVGFFYDLSDNWALRGDLRSVTYFGSSSGTDAVASVGALYRFAENKPAPAPVDGDDDQDGVLNSKDKCPNTPLNNVVNADGCPIVVTQNVVRDLKVNFDTDKWDVKPQYYSEIASLASLLKEYPDAKVEIQGHADASGRPDKNQILSQNRANAIADLLNTSFGIAKQRITAVGYGASRPIADNATVEGRAKNRRMLAVTQVQVKVIVKKPEAVPAK